MKVTVERLTSIEEAYKDALVTVHKVPKKEPTKEWWVNMLYAEHSPIRSCIYRIRFEDIKSWVATHFARHHVGMEKFISTQRPDRTDPNIDRDSLGQGELVNLNIVINAQSWINVSRKRLCSNASSETTEAWLLALNELEKIDPSLRSVCVKECLYRGFCPELTTCGYTNTARYINFLYKYRCGGPNGRKKDAESEKQRTQSRVSELQESGTKSEKQSSSRTATRKTSRRTRSTKRTTAKASNGSTRENKTE